MTIQQLQLKWAEYRYRVKEFEKRKEDELRAKYPHLADTEIDEKVLKSVDVKFNKEAKDLLALHMDLTSRNERFK